MNTKIIVGAVCALLLTGMAPVLETSHEQLSNTVSVAPSTTDARSDFSYTLEEATRGHVSVTLDDTSTWLRQPGAPMLPRMVRHLELPFGATNVRVDVAVPGYDERILDADVVPAQPAVPYTGTPGPRVQGWQKNRQLYASSQPYPSGWYSVRVGCGLNGTLHRVTHVTVDLYPVRYRPADDTLLVARSMNLDVSYDAPRSSIVVAGDGYDLVVVAPPGFSDELAPLVEHKNSHGVITLLKTTEDIYASYDGVDRPEQIKYFIKDAVESYGISYVLLVGGLRSPVYGSARDTLNYGVEDWHVPVRYSNLYDEYGDPGFLCDLYYADVYGAGDVFDDWDSNDDGVIGARGRPGVQDDDIDLYPDVAVGRLPCRNSREVQACVEKIITYETSAAGSDWFNRIVAVAGDGLQDQEDLDIQWDVSGLPPGEYTIHARSRSAITGEWGPVDTVSVTVDPGRESSLSFSEDDHLRIDSYPGPAMAEITSPSDGDVLGSTDVDFTPQEAYMGYLWANVTYIDGVMHIRGKSYDPRPYGYHTDITAWVENGDGETVFSQQKNMIRSYCDCEWTTGNREVGGDRAGAFHYMPESFEKIFLWASNGNFTSQRDVLDTLGRGCGFAFFFGHASPSTMIVNMPGMPGGFSNSAEIGLQPINIGMPVFPMDNIDNTDKLPIVAVMGCHNSQFNVTLLNSVLGWNRVWTGFYPTPECWSWWLTRMPRSGAIATIGCTALGPGMYDQAFVPDTGCWIFPEFFRQYGEERHHVLGDAFTQTLTSYTSTFGQANAIDVQMVQELALFGDPSLRIGGYP
ncbi:MAG: C25 family cysteine peptidase [Thermoplasmatota archaeon]